jgi:hypothetical protein
MRNAHPLFQTTVHRRFELCIPRNQTARPCSQVPYSCICEWFIYYLDRSTYIFCCSHIANRLWEYIDRSQIYECRNSDWGSFVFGNIFPIFGTESSQFRICRTKCLDGLGGARSAQFCVTMSLISKVRTARSKPSSKEIVSLCSKDRCVAKARRSRHWTSVTASSRARIIKAA